MLFRPSNYLLSLSQTRVLWGCWPLDGALASRARTAAAASTDEEVSDDSYDHAVKPHNSGGAPSDDPSDGGVVKNVDVEGKAADDGDDDTNEEAVIDDTVLQRVAFSAEEASAPKSSSVSVFGIVRYADRTDKILMIVGLILAVCGGGGMPAFSFIFGSMLDNLYSDSDQEKQTAKTAAIMVYVGCGMLVAAGGHVLCWTTAFAESRAAAYEIFLTVDRVPPVDIEASGESVDGLHDCIEFDDVKFSYPTRPDMVLFRDLCLTIKKGQKVAFSGCGKSSAIGLIQRCYDPIDGRDMRELDLFQWCSQIGIVSQEPSLFAGTMWENVRVGKPDATDEEIMEACKQANIHNTIVRLPDAYNTEVGAVGSHLLGGQKQRIAITRALGNVTESKVQRGIDKFTAKHGLTTVSIAHCLTTIRNCDQIVLLDAGHIIEQGSHDELIALGGGYKARWELYNGSSS